MKRNMMIIGLLTVGAMLSGCSTTSTQTVTSIDTSDNASSEVQFVLDEGKTQADPVNSDYSSEAEQTDSTASSKRTVKGTVTEKKEPSSKSISTDKETEIKDREQKFFSVDKPIETSISVASLTGVWNCTTSDSTLWFTQGDDIYSGTWHDQVEGGVVKLEYSLNESGNKLYWFNLYNDRNEIWFSIYATGELPLDEFVVKNDGGNDFRYVRETEGSDREYHLVESPVGSSISVASLEGVWNCTTSDSTLWFTQGDDIYSGTWHDQMESGDVKLEYSLNESGEKLYWFNLYNDRNELWFSIYATGELPLDELVVKNDGGDDFRYVRDTGGSDTSA